MSIQLKHSHMKNTFMLQDDVVYEQIYLNLT